MNESWTEPWLRRNPRVRRLCIAVLVVPFAYATLKARLVGAGVNLGPVTLFDRVLLGLSPMLMAIAGIVEWWDTKRNRDRLLLFGLVLSFAALASALMLYKMFEG